MKRYVWMNLILCAVLGWPAWVMAKPFIYKWVKDKSVSSAALLSESQSARVVSIPEAQALEAVRQVMTDDLYMALAEYHKTRHRQDGETVKDTVLPENVVSKEEVDLVGDEDEYRFVLEVRLKAYAGRTRILAKVHPMYRIRDWEKEAARDEDTETDTTVDIKVKAPHGSAVGLDAGIFVVPMEGLPANYQIEPLPDAADRSAKLVRSFLYLLDQRLAGKSPQ